MAYLKPICVVCAIAALALAAGAGPLSGADMNEIASFSSSVEGQDEQVRRNISLACAKLDGTVVMPGALFSFNETVGEASLAAGYAEGRVLYMDHVRYEAGGGLCQVSSTLFNTFLLAGFSIGERHRHYQPVTYVPLGLDATIKYGKKDLKMRNPYPFAVRVSAAMNDRSLVVSLRAEGRLPVRYEIATEEDTVEAPFDESGKKVRQGISVEVYRRAYRDERLIETRLLYRDYYPPVYMP